MANSFGSLYIGAAGLKSSQNAINTTANNLANVDTTGYVRQKVLFSDRNYITFDITASVSKQQAGLGVQIADVLHTRDIFLDRSYRTESGRQAFYASTYEATTEVETFLQEMEGEAFQDAVEDFWVSFQELSKAPDDNIYQNLVVQKAQLFVSRGAAVYSGLQSYQYNINTQISDDIDQINELGKTINELNNQIMKIEAADIETAMTLRDARDLALDELSALVEISYHETANGIVRVNIEGTEFVDEVTYHKIEKKTDKLTGFITPYWGYLSDVDRGKYVNVFNFDTDISTENQNDMGALKALVLARGDHIANYTDIEGMDKDTYNDTTGMSIMLNAEAQLDQMIHGIVTAINDLLCPNVEADSLISDLTGGTANSINVTLEDGSTVTLKSGMKILDADNCSTGADGQLPPQELFVRIGTERYTKATYTYTTTDDAGNTVTETKDIYIYNEEDPDDDTKQYTLKSLSVNEAMIYSESALPHLRQNGDVNYELAAQLAAVWEQESMYLSPNDTKMCTFKDYYESMVGELATLGNVYGETATSLSGTVTSVENQRQQVIGVSSDEELTYLIKYQNAYNAASRYINVIDEMIEHLITQLG